MSELPFTTRLFNGIGSRGAYFYVRHLMRSDIQWETEVPTGPKIIACNHPTTSDPFFMMCWPLEPIHILITESAFKVPLLGRFLKLAGHVPVYTGRGREAYYEALRLLAGGHTVGIFPEGELSDDDGQMVTSRTGAVRLAVTEKVPIVPCGVALDWHFVSRRQMEQFGVSEKMRWFWLGAYEATSGPALLFEHGAEDREAVRRSTDVLIREIERLVCVSADRLLDAAWPPRKAGRENELTRAQGDPSSSGDRPD